MSRRDRGAVVEHESREDVERQADLVRARLLHTLDCLDRRRHELTNLRLQARRHPLPFAAAALGVLALGGAIAFALRRRHARHSAAPVREEQRSAPVEIARRVLVGTATFLGTQVTRRWVSGFWARRELGAWRPTPRWSNSRLRAR